MNELKYKKRLMKKRKKLRKNTRKRQKENAGKLESAAKKLNRLLSQMSKRGVRKDLGRLRVKGRQQLEGMFFKGIRSEYITRESLNEHNEARKNEDLHKIIDIGRDFLQKAQRPARVERCTKRIPDNPKPRKSSHDLREVSTEEGIENFEQCSLSPISLADSPRSECDADANAGRKDLEKEFERFALKYEEAVEAQVLLRLPGGGVLEDALEGLRKTGEKEENGKFSGKETTFLGELKFAREELAEQEMPGAEEEEQEEEGFIESFAFPAERFPAPASHYRDAFHEKPLENLLIVTEGKAEGYNHPSWAPPFCNGDTHQKNPFDYFFGKRFKTSVADLTIVTPPIRFYRRNMF